MNEKDATMEKGEHPRHSAAAHERTEWGERTGLARTWYLAASWSARDAARQCRIETAKVAPGWTCTAEWLDVELDHATMAAVDACATASADALVLMGPQTPTPGKLTELGIALACAVPAYLVRLPGEAPPAHGTHRNIFELLAGAPVAWEQWIEAPFAEWTSRKERARTIARAIRAGDASRCRNEIETDESVGEQARDLMARTRARWW